MLFDFYTVLMLTNDTDDKCVLNYNKFIVKVEIIVADLIIINTNN